jgi:hypothetical protein
MVVEVRIRIADSTTKMLHDKPVIWREISQDSRVRLRIELELNTKMNG